MEPEIVLDTDLETIINNFACKEMRRHETFRSWFFSESTHWQSDRDQGHFNKFVIKYLCIFRTNAIAIAV